MKKAFFDTNIVVYYYTSTEPEKRQSAASILLQSQGIISTQVLNELSNVLSKKYHFSWTEISSVTEDLSGNFEVKVVNEAIITKAIACAKKYNYSYYDSLILASALEAECSILYSEDFQDGQVIEGLKIINPFLHIA